MAKVAKVVRTVTGKIIDTITKILCTDISYSPNPLGINVTTVTLTATFSSTWNGLKAVFIGKVTGQFGTADTLTTEINNLTAGTYTGYEVIGSGIIADGSATFSLDIPTEFSAMFVSAYVLPAHTVSDGTEISLS